MTNLYQGILVKPQDRQRFIQSGLSGQLIFQAASNYLKEVRDGPPESQVCARCGSVSFRADCAPAAVYVLRGDLNMIAVGLCHNCSQISEKKLARLLDRTLLDMISAGSI